MSEPRRASRGRGGSAGKAPDSVSRAAEPSTAPATQPAWATPVTGASPFPLAGVQRKVTIGAPDDTYEREAESVASRVASGHAVAPEQISPITGALGASRAAKPAADEKKKEDKPAAKPVQKAAAPEQKKGENRKMEEKKDEKPAAGKPVQKAAAPDSRKKDDEKKPAAAAKPVQKAEKVKEKKEGETLEDKLKDAPVQKAPASALAPSAAMEDTAARAIQTKGAGEPLQPSTREKLESRMGADLSGVRVHDDAAARQAADAIDARAFTHGSDVWLGSGESQGDLGLMAHEATHVVQQAGGAHRLPIQRAGKGGAKQAEEPSDSPGAEGGEWEFESPLGKINKTSKKISIPQLKVPTFKKPFTPSPLALPPRDDMPDRTDEQRKIWEDKAGEGSVIDDKIDEKCEKDKAPAVQQGGEPMYFLELPGQSFYVIGTKKKIKERVLRPFWNKEGQINPFQVDHKQEHQLTQAGEDPDRIDNFWLLDAGTNMASGRNIRNERNDRVEALLAAATKSKKKKKKGADADEGKSDAKNVDPGKAKPIFDKPQDPKTIRNTYQITFEKVVGGLEPSVAKPKTWSLEDIKDQAAQLKALKVLNDKEINARGLRGSPRELVIYTNATGAGLRKVEDWPEGGKKKKTSLEFGKQFLINEVEYDSESKTGKVHGVAFPNHKLVRKAKLSFDIQQMDAVLNGGFIPVGSVNNAVSKKLELLGMSPIEMYYVELTSRGLVGRGRVLPTVPLIRDVGIDLVLDGDDVYLSKVFSANDFKFPGPIQVTSASLEIFGGTKGLGATGTVMFEVDRVGTGRLFAQGAMGKGFSIGGGFDFDAELFDPAHIEMQYVYADDKGTFSGAGEIGIKPGKVKGIKSANLKVTFVDDKIDAVGTVKPDIPAIEQGDMEFHYAPETGVVISGSLLLKKDTPGIESGSVKAELAKRPGDDRWRVKASGEAVPKIPGASAKLMITYDDGQFDLYGIASYEKGMLKGGIQIGVTNRPVSPEGVPGGAPAEKTDAVTLYGGGSLTLRLAPWLQATAAVRLLPNGEIEVTGQIGLPAALELFEGKEFKKNIFKVGIDIPIIGLSAAGANVGIFATIGGGLDVEAGIGPGALQDLSLGVTYNPAHEDQTHVFGSASLHIPAHAGLRLFVSGSLGVGIPIVEARAGLEVGGSLGIEGALDAAVQVDWTPTKGLDIQAVAEIYAEPKFRFDITGFVLVELDLWVDTIELYSQRWQLASFEYGSGLRLGLKLPIHYVEGQPFDVSLSDIQFEVPSIDPMNLLSGLVKQIV
jgi:hypothetical protein